jgi:ADP-ribosylglycohydrolase
MNLNKRAFAAMLGMAAADAISWPALFHRSYLLPFWTRRLRRKMDGDSETKNVTSLPMPFSLNQPATAFSICPTDDTEWAAFTAKQFIIQHGELDPRQLTAAWIQLARSASPVRGSISIQSALENLRRGKLPPISGHDNPHYFDDSALCRAVPIGIACTGQPDRAAALAEMDASITNSEEGVEAAKIMAVLISRACAGEKLDEIIDSVLALLSAHSWLGLTVRRALAICEGASSVFQIFPALSDQIINREYSYGNSAPETLALVLAILKTTAADFETAVFSAAAFAKTADSVPALVGASCGAMQKQGFDEPHWIQSVQSLKGICIPDLAGENFIKIAEKLAQLAEKRGD